MKGLLTFEVLKLWAQAWIQSKHSRQQVLSIGLSSRAQYLQKETFFIWLTWLKMKQLVETKKLDVSLYQKRRLGWSATDFKRASYFAFTLTNVFCA